ncbi:secreted frizzled-related protein 5 [Egretta garzetta]|uniref:secreted frizzled-related protein 5 n=1 Tax=Egretta garzetta TaxID=188379 RepID=UPI00051EEDAA|nr:secreted frizzled-related protein 5 [Egretta garzetta]
MGTGAACADRTEGSEPAPAALEPSPSPGPASPLAFIWWGARRRRVLGTPSTFLGGTGSSGPGWGTGATLSGGWGPEAAQRLLARQGHRDTQLFLCSLFAPVCLDRPVYPCRSLCEVVRDSCAPVMESYGFPWPEMLHCGKFPSDHELCIAVQFGNSKATPPPVSKICTQCEMEHKADGMMEQMCSSDFVVKMRIKEITEENGERRLVAAQKKKVLKLGPLKRKDTKKMVLHMRNAGACPCPQLDSLSGSFLVMGRKVGGRLLLLAVYPWQKHNKEMKFAVKFMFSYPCPLYHPLLYGAGQH